MCTKSFTSSTTSQLDRLRILVSHMMVDILLTATTLEPHNRFVIVVQGLLYLGILFYQFSPHITIHFCYNLSKYIQFSVQSQFQTSCGKLITVQNMQNILPSLPFTRYGPCFYMLHYMANKVVFVQSFYHLCYKTLIVIPVASIKYIL